MARNWCFYLVKALQCRVCAQTNDMHAKNNMLHGINNTKMPKISCDGGDPTYLEIFVPKHTTIHTQH